MELKLAVACKKQPGEITKDEAKQLADFFLLLHEMKINYDEKCE